MLRISTQANPTTEMIVSITDQVLMVCPTVIPKYSLTSQKPASLTCEKNSDPQPIASTSSATSGALSVVASGATMPAAVMVATVADPVATRIPTATRYPSSSAEMLASLAASATTLPTPASTSTCLKPPPAATMSRMPAIGGSAPPTTDEVCTRLKPARLPSEYIASSSPKTSATGGLPSTSRASRTLLPL